MLKRIHQRMMEDLADQRIDGLAEEDSELFMEDVEYYMESLEIICIDKIKMIAVLLYAHNKEED